MFGFVLRRVLQMVPMLIAIALLIFVLFSLIPGSFATGQQDEGLGLDMAVVARMRAELGLDDPLYVRFGRYVQQLATLDLGISFRSKQPVIEMISARLWPSLSLTAAAMGFAISVGLPLGFVAALRPGSVADLSLMVIAVSGLSLPVFWLGILLMYLFALTLGWFPSFGYGDGGLWHLALPAMALGVSPMALLARTTRAAVLDIMNADFVRTARSKGMNEFRVVVWHVLRNALVLVLTTIGLQFGSLLGQGVVVEKLFAWPGVGSLLVDSVFQRDIPAVQGCILMITLFFLVINTSVDIAYKLIDPRIRYT
ncbi:MAG: ABC transporter permease [Acetobacteraceae bacterium]|nr:ABC transporter permease [Acetobacteraceae bacterium]